MYLKHMYITQYIVFFELLKFVLANNLVLMI